MITKKEFFDLTRDLGLLKKVKRTGWILKGVKEVESVADHTWRVVMLSLLFASDLGFDELKLVKMALVHDLGEIEIGDVRWEKGAKVIGSQTKKHQGEARTIRKIFGDNPSFKEYLDLWEEFVAQKTPEAKIIKQLDKLEMAIQALEYQKAGYSGHSLQEFWENVEKYLKGKTLEEYFEFLKKERRRVP